MPYEKCVNVEQENAIEELKNRVRNELTSPALLQDDAVFYKFLKARGFDIDKAEKMLRKHIAWRKVFQIDGIVETFKPKEVYVKYGEPNFVGYDKVGDIVMYSSIGRVNAENFFKCMKMNDTFRHFTWFMEKYREIACTTDKKKSACGIIDMDKLQFANASSKWTIELVQRLVNDLQVNYAEKIKAVYIINAPSYFVILYTIIKAILSHKMMKRLHVFGFSGWKEKLVEVISPDVLPAFLGGKRTDPDGDPYCKSFISSPGIIPEKYYLSEEERYFENLDEVTTLIIPASEIKEVSVHVREAKSLIRWKFMVRRKTIRFGLFFEEPRKKRKEIIPLYEYETTDGTEDNSYKCLSIGKYIIIFDNSYSKFSSKEVQYSVRVEK